MTYMKIQTRQLTFMAMALVLNILMGNVALLLRLPIYLDTIGTLLAATLFGPLAGIIVGLLSSLITGMTSDLFSLYYAPVQLCVGATAGFLLYQKKLNWSLPFKTLLVALPGTIVASLITVYLFGGITSSGSSIIVQFLYGLGLNKTLSVFLIQIITDYADKLISILLVFSLLKLLKQAPANYKRT